MFRLAFVILALAGAMPAAAQSRPAEASFDIGGVVLRMAIPAGYCEPGPGFPQQLAAGLAKLDAVNRTLLTLFRCDDDLKGEGASDYTMIKTLASAQSVSIDRAQLLAQMRATYASNPDIATANARMGETVAKRFGEVTGVEPEVKGGVALRGVDTVCAYLDGNVEYSAPGVAAYTQPMAACITSVGNRMIYIYRYGRDTSAAGLAQLKQEVRALADTVHVASTT